jgi:1-deoxy-D-xylulose-5-phosphate synthase
MRSIPNMIVSAPMDELELRNLLFTAQNENHGPFSIRYPRGCGSVVDWEKPMNAIPVGQSRKLTEGADAAVLTIGTIGIQTDRAVKMLQKEGIGVAHYDMRFVKPLDHFALHEIFSKYNKVITIEDGVLQGGFGSAVLEFMSDQGYQAQLKRLGLPDRFIDHGTTDELFRELGLHQQGIYQAIKSIVKQN